MLTLKEVFLAMAFQAADYFWPVVLVSGPIMVIAVLVALADRRKPC